MPQHTEAAIYSDASHHQDQDCMTVADEHGITIANIAAHPLHASAQATAKGKFVEVAIWMMQLRQPTRIVIQTANLGHAHPCHRSKSKGAHTF